jgi:hypothetical protein
MNRLRRPAGSRRGACSHTSTRLASGARLLGRLFGGKRQKHGWSRGKIFSVEGNFLLLSYRFFFFHFHDEENEKIKQINKHSEWKSISSSGLEWKNEAEGMELSIGKQGASVALFKGTRLIIVTENVFLSREHQRWDLLLISSQQNLEIYKNNNTHRRQKYPKQTFSDSTEHAGRRKPYRRWIFKVELISIESSK